MAGSSSSWCSCWRCCSEAGTPRPTTRPATRSRAAPRSAGVDVGDRTEARAERVLRQGLRERDRPADHGDDRRADRAGDARGRRASPSTTAPRSTRRCGSRAGSPPRSGTTTPAATSLDAVVTVDRARLDALVARLDEADGTPATDGAVAFRRDGPRVTAPRTGERLDAAETGAALRAAYLQDDPRADLTLHREEPDIDAGDVQRAMARFANPAMSSSVRLLFGRTPVVLQPRDYAPALSLVPEDGRAGAPARRVGPAAARRRRGGGRRCARRRHRRAGRRSPAGGDGQAGRDLPPGRRRRRFPGLVTRDVGSAPDGEGGGSPSPASRPATRAG